MRNCFLKMMCLLQNIEAQCVLMSALWLEYSDNVCASIWLICSFTLCHGCLKVFLEQDPLRMSDFYLMPLLFFYFVLRNEIVSHFFKEISFFMCLDFSKNSWVHPSVICPFSCKIILSSLMVAVPQPPIFMHLPCLSYRPSHALPCHTSQNNILPILYFLIYMKLNLIDYIYFLTTYSLFLSLNFIS